MYNSQILEEIYRYREEYARSFNYDLKAIFNDLRKKQIVHEDRVVRLPIKRRSNLSLEVIRSRKSAPGEGNFCTSS